jgi:hypothetical protein
MILAAASFLAVCLYWLHRRRVNEAFSDGWGYGWRAFMKVNQERERCLIHGNVAMIRRCPRCELDKAWPKGDNNANT